MAASHAMPHLSHSFTGALRTFAYFMSSGTHYMLERVDYLRLYGSEPSAIEQAYAIFANVLELDESGQVLNAQHARKRATFSVSAWLAAQFLVWQLLATFTAEGEQLARDMTKRAVLTPI